MRRYAISAVAFGWIVASCALSQERYLSNENAISAGLFFGRYGTDNKWGFECSYSLKGVLQLSYTRSSALVKGPFNNFQNEYFLRVYAPQARRLFFSVGGGYIYQKVNTELWKGFPLGFVREGVAFEGALHLVTEHSQTRRIVVSIAYMYFRPTEELHAPALLTSETKPAHSFTADVAVVYYLGKVVLVVGPRVALDSDFKNVFAGVHSSLLIRH